MNRPWKDTPMSVRAALKIDGLLEAANDSWADWTAPEPVLTQFTSSGEVALWRKEAVWQDDREVLLALGRLTLVERSRLEATAVLVALVLPACEAVVAQRTRGVRDFRHVEEVAAGYLWSAVAEYPWKDPLKGWIPQGVARRVGRALDREFGWGESAERVWRDRAPLLPEQVELLPAPDRGTEPLQSSDLYLWALTKGGVSREDLDLLVALAVAASDAGTVSRSSAGLTARSACLQVARPGKSVDQLQYRARQALKVLRGAAGREAA